MPAPNPSEIPTTPKSFRRLKSHELVSVGDFVGNEQQGLDLWEGPNGFRADSFIKAIYRRSKSHSAAHKKSKIIVLRPGGTGVKAG